MSDINRGIVTPDQLRASTGAFGQASERLGLENKRDERPLPRVSYAELALRFGIGDGKKSFDLTDLKNRQILQGFTGIAGARGMAKLDQGGRKAIFPFVVIPTLPGEFPHVEILATKQDRVSPQDPVGSQTTLNGLQQQLLDMALSQNMPDVGADENCSSTSKANAGDVAHGVLLATRLAPGDIHADAHRLGQTRALTAESMRSTTIYTKKGFVRATNTSAVPVHRFDEITFTELNQVPPTTFDLDVFAAGPGIALAATAMRSNSAMVPDVNVLANQQAMLGRAA